MPYQGVALAFVIGFGLATAAFLYFFEQQRAHENRYHYTDYEPVNSWNRPTSGNRPASGNTNNSNSNGRRRRRGSRTNCAICFDKIPPSNTRALTCGHLFHQQCIAQWLEEKRECPMCRTQQ